MYNKQSSSVIHVLLAALTGVGLGVFLFVARNVYAQKITKLEIEQGRNMLRNVKSEFMKNYYDPTFHGMEIEERFKLADEKMKNAESNGQLFGIIAQVLLDLNDSHTLFAPPGRSSRVEYGWQMKPVGGDCYVSAVQPGSDAEWFRLRRHSDGSLQQPTARESGRVALVSRPRARRDSAQCVCRARRRLHLAR